MINKEKIISDLAERTGFTKKASRKFIETFTELIREYMLADEKVKIMGLFTAEVQDYKRTVGRNPKTGERVDIAPRKKIRIKASRELNEKVNESLLHGDTTA